MFQAKNGRDSTFNRYCKRMNEVFAKWSSRENKSTYMSVFSPENWNALPKTQTETHSYTVLTPSTSYVGPVLCGPGRRRFTLHNTNRASARLNIKMGGVHDVSLTLTFDLIKLLLLCKCSTIEKWIAVAQSSAYSYSQGQASTPNEE